MGRAGAGKARGRRRLDLVRNRRHIRGAGATRTEHDMAERIEYDPNEDTLNDVLRK